MKIKFSSILDGGSIKFQIFLPTMRHGFIKGCKCFIGLYGYHLKGPFGGVLLFIVYLYTNSWIFPLALCV